MNTKALRSCPISQRRSRTWDGANTQRMCRNLLSVAFQMKSYGHLSGGSTRYSPKRLGHELIMYSRKCDANHRLQQMYHVKAMSGPPPGGLDLNIADEDEFSPDKLRSNIERLYMTVIIGLMGFGKHIARLRSWKEPRRTAAYCAVCQHQSVSQGEANFDIGVHHCMVFQLLDTPLLHHPCRAYRLPTSASYPFPSCTIGLSQFEDRWSPIS